MKNNLSHQKPSYLSQLKELMLKAQTQNADLSGQIRKASDELKEVRKKHQSAIEQSNLRLAESKQKIQAILVQEGIHKDLLKFPFGTVGFVLSGLMPKNKEESIALLEDKFPELIRTEKYLDTEKLLLIYENSEGRKTLDCLGLELEEEWTFICNLTNNLCQEKS